MKKIRLGNSDLVVSALGLGCIDFGSHIDERTAFSLMDAYVEHGGNFLDTANNYIFWDGFTGSESERTIGNWLASRNVRDSVVLATKVGALPKDASSSDFSNMQGLRRKTIIEAVAKSLDNLKSDHIDLLYLHVDDYDTPQEETLETLDELVEKHLVREIGCSNFRTWRIERARTICRQHDYRFFCAVQQRYSYLAPTLDADFTPQVAAGPELADYLLRCGDLTMVAYSPLLAGLYTKGGKIEQEVYDTRTNRQKLRALLDGPEPAIPWVLNYITGRFGGSVVLSTTSNTHHLVENMQYIG